MESILWYWIPLVTATCRLIRLITFALLDLTVPAERPQFVKASAFRRQNGVDLPLGAAGEDGGRRPEGCE